MAAETKCAGRGSTTIEKRHFPALVGPIRVVHASNAKPTYQKHGDVVVVNFGAYNVVCFPMERQRMGVYRQLDDDTLSVVSQYFSEEERPKLKFHRVAELMDDHENEYYCRVMGMRGAVARVTWFEGGGTLRVDSTEDLSLWASVPLS